MEGHRRGLKSRMIERRCDTMCHDTDPVSSVSCVARILFLLRLCFRREAVRRPSSRVSFEDPVLLKRKKAESEAQRGKPRTKQNNEKDERDVGLY